MGNLDSVENETCSLSRMLEISYTLDEDRCLFF